MYDAGTRPEQYLRAYAREFASVEIDSTWYGTPPPERVRAWTAAVPAGFTFALKLPREITHERRLAGCEEPLATFVASAELFGAHLEGVLIQLPPEFGTGSFATLAAFVALLPVGIRWSVELRDPAWFAAATLPELQALLAAHDVALTATDGTFVAVDTMLAVLAAPTARHGYVRWLGARDAFSRFDHAVFDRRRELARWAHAVRAAAPPLERLCAYAGNEYAGHSPATVRDFYHALSVPHTIPPHIEQTSLF